MTFKFTVLFNNVYRKRNDESFLNNDENWDCICINPNTSNGADFTVTLRLNRSKYLKNIVFSHLNINSIRNKFENLKDVVSNHVDILVIAETKIDNRSLRLSLKLKDFINL